jgi:hypothetical protein
MASSTSVWKLGLCRGQFTPVPVPIPIRSQFVRAAGVGVGAGATGVALGDGLAGDDGVRSPSPQEPNRSASGRIETRDSRRDDDVIRDPPGKNGGLG